MRMTEKHRATIRSIRHSEQKDFMTLARIAGLNPKSDFRHANLSGIDFGSADLKGFDFTGADLRGADLRYASIDGAIFTDTDTVGTLWPGKRPLETSHFKPSAVDIFIGYSSVDRLFVRRLADTL